MELVTGGEAKVMRQIANSIRQGRLDQVNPQAVAGIILSLLHTRNHLIRVVEELYEKERIDEEIRSCGR